MSGSFLVPIIVPIVAVLTLAIWLGMVFRADAHPGWKAHAEAPGSEVSAIRLPFAADGPGVQHGSEPTPSLQEERKAA